MAESRLTGDPRWDQPCEHWLDEFAAEPDREPGYCGAMPTRRFVNGRCCAQHTPSALAGHPEPGRTAYTMPDRPAPEPAAPTPPPVNSADLPPVERSKTAAAARQETKARIAAAKTAAREAAQASAGGR